MIRCKICGKEVRDNLTAHINKQHKISKNEYLAKYPGSSLYSEDYLKRRSANASITNKNRWRNKEFKENMSKKLSISMKRRLGIEVDN